VGVREGRLAGAAFGTNIVLAVNKSAGTVLCRGLDVGVSLLVELSAVSVILDVLELIGGWFELASEID
jgi:hypothetical protein